MTQISFLTTLLHDLYSQTKPPSEKFDAESSACACWLRRCRIGTCMIDMQPSLSFAGRLQKPDWRSSCLTCRGPALRSPTALVGHLFPVLPEERGGQRPGAAELSFATERCRTGRP
eukprot:EG_transcript_30626